MGFGFLLFTIGIFLHPVAVLIEKHGINQIGKIDNFTELFSVTFISKVITNPFVMGGIFLLGINTFLWLGAISHFKVNYLVPLGSISYIVLAVLSYFFLGGSLTLVKAIGILVIVVGVALISM